MYSFGEYVFSVVGHSDGCIFLCRWVQCYMYDSVFLGTVLYVLSVYFHVVAYSVRWIA